MKTKETSTKQIYITVVTKGLTMLANKVARVLQPNEDTFDACSDLANDIAKENGLEWCDVLVQYFNHYSDEFPAMDFKVPAKPELTKAQASKWFASKSYLEQHELSDKYFESRNPSLLTIEQVEDIWKKETQYDRERTFVAQMFNSRPNQKQFKQFDESLFKAYIDKFSDQDLHKALILIGEKLCKTGYIKDFSYSQKK